MRLENLRTDDGRGIRRLRAIESNPNRLFSCHHVPNPGRVALAEVGEDESGEQPSPLVFAPVA